MRVELVSPAAEDSAHSGASILSRFTCAPRTSLLSPAAFLPSNLCQRRLTAEKIAGRNRFFWRDRQASPGHRNAV
jgi:hypothetical protein